MAPGAVAPMNHPFMNSIAIGLANRDIATLRFNFPYMQSLSRQIDKPDVLHRTVRAAVDVAQRLLPDLPIFAGGRSFGGLVSSEAQSKAVMLNVKGIVFVGFPLHPISNPSIERGKHLQRVAVPMLFVQGTRDALARSDLLEDLVADLGTHATLRWVEEADHSFKKPNEGRSAIKSTREVVDGIATWMARRTMTETIGAMSLDL